MQQSINKILKQLNKIEEKISNSSKGLSFADITGMATALTFIFENLQLEQVKQIRTRLSYIFDRVLKYQTLGKQWQSDTENQKQIQERLQLFWEVIAQFEKVSNTKQQSELFKNMCSVQNITKFALLIVTPCLASLKQKKLIQFITNLSNSTSQFSLMLSSLILQVLHMKKHPKLSLILSQYTRNLLTLFNNRTLTQMQRIIKELFNRIGDIDFYISGKILTIFLQQYMKQFQSNYVRNGKYISSKWDARFVGGLLKEIVRIKNEVNFELVKQEQFGEQILGNFNKCNFCQNKTNNFQYFILQVSNSSYSIFLCQQCKQNLSNPNPIQLLTILYISTQHITHNSSTNSLHVPNLLSLIQIIDIPLQLDKIVYCQNNKQLKLIKESILRYIVLQNGLNNFWNKLWAMLMILSHNDDNNMRSKSAKVIGELVEEYMYQNQQPGLLENIQKCIMNRLVDIDVKTRQEALNTYINILPFVHSSIQVIIPTIRTQLIQSNTTVSANFSKSTTAKMIIQIVQKLNILLKNNKIKERWANNIDQLIKWIKIIGQLLCAYDSAIKQQERLSKNSKNSKKSKKQNTSNIQPIKILRKHKITIKQYMRIYQAKKPDLQYLIHTLLNQQKLTQQQYNYTIKILTQICKITLQEYICDNQMSNYLLGGISYDEKDLQESNIKCVQDKLWLKCQDVVKIFVQYKDGQILWKIIKSVQEACITIHNNSTHNVYKLCMNNCHILSHLLPQVSKKQSIRSAHRTHLEQLREQLITKLLPQVNTFEQDYFQDLMKQQQYFNEQTKNKTQRMNQVIGHDNKIICKTISCIDIILNDCRYTLSIYLNCWKIINNICQTIQTSVGQKKQNNQKVQANIEITQKITNNNKNKNKSSLQQQQKNHNQTLQQREQKIKLIIQTVNIMICMLPELIKSCQEINNKTNSQIQIQTHIQDIYDLIKFIITAQSKNYQKVNLQRLNGTVNILFQATHLFCRVIQLSPLFIINSTQFILNLLSLNLPFPTQHSYMRMILSSIYHVLCFTTSVAVLEKIRDIFMYIINRLDDKKWKRLLRYNQMYKISKQLVIKGLSSWHSVNKIILYGLVRGRVYEQKWEQFEEQIIITICAQVVNETSSDINQSRQLFNNFSEILKFILVSINPLINHRLFFDISSMVHNNSSSVIFSKKEQSQIALRINIFKVICQQLNKIVISNKFINSTSQTVMQIGLISNTLTKCEKIAVDDWKIVVRSLMTILQSVYFEYIGAIKQYSLAKQIQMYEEEHYGASLWKVLLVLKYFLGSFSYKEAYNAPQKFYKIKDDLIQLQKDNFNYQYKGLKSLQQIYDSILYGEQYFEDQSDQSETYDTSQNKNYTNSNSRVSTKPKNITKQKMVAKKTKKQPKGTKVRNKTAPKHSFQYYQVFNLDIRQNKQCDSSNIQYKRRLRNRTKIPY